jgi:hypothetical protein
MLEVKTSGSQDLIVNQLLSTLSVLQQNLLLESINIENNQ